MEMPRPTDEDRAYFRALVPADERVEVKPMFGNLGAFVNANMFMGLFGPQVGLRLPAEDAERLRAEGGGPFGPSERPMGGYVALPEAWHSRPEHGAAWVSAALAHIAELPPKVPKRRTPRAR